MTSRFLVIGCGGIGGVLAAHLAAQGLSVTVLSRNEQIRQVAERHGLRVRGRANLDTPVRVIPSLGRTEPPFDYVLLATQPNQVQRAAESALPWLAPDGKVVCFQNGLCEERVAGLVGPERVIGAVVLWGASVLEPGVLERTSKGGFTLGTLDGSLDAQLERLASALSAIGRVSRTKNLRGVRWSKLAINCGVSTLGTLSGLRVGQLMRRHDARQLGIELVSEAIQVANADGVRVEKLAGTLDLGWLAQDPKARASGWSLGLMLKHLLVFAAIIPYRRLRSSMLAAIEQGKPPAVDFLNGEVVERAERYHIPVPVNRAARELVWAISRGEAQPSVETLRGLYLCTRPGDSPIGNTTLESSVSPR